MSLIMKYFLFNLLLFLSLFFFISSSSNFNRVKINGEIDVTATAPLIHCSKPQTNQTSHGECSFYAVVLASSTPGIVITNNINNGGYNASGEYFLGKTNVEFTATNKTTMMTSICDTSVTLNDIETPTLVCPSDITTSNDPGQCDALIFISNLQITDNCGIASITNSFNGQDNPSGKYPVGITNVVITATDFSGNGVSCTFTVNVIDTQPPYLYCPADETKIMKSGCQTSIDLPPPTVSDNCPGVTVTSSGQNQTYPVGTNVITYTATDQSGNIASCDTKITVLDVTPPTITCPASLTLSTDPGSCDASDVTLPKATCQDECSYTISINAPNVFDVGTTTIVYACADDSGNVAACNTKVEVIDTEPPTITCPSDISQRADPGVCTAYVDVSNPVVSDNCAIESITNSENNNLNASGVYNVGDNIITFTASDFSGNIASCMIDVDVVNSDPSIQC